MNSPAIEPENVSRRFEDVVAVDDVSFLVNLGSICVMPGDNGAGTILSMLLGLRLPTAVNRPQSFLSSSWIRLIYSSTGGRFVGVHVCRTGCNATLYSGRSA